MPRERGYTGTMMEREIFGKITELSHEKDYINYRNSVEIVKKSQSSEDPSDPDPSFANDLHATLAEQLQLEDYGSLKFYTAVGSHLDVYHGVDAFFEIELERNSIVVTMDVTIRPDASGKYKADVIFYMPKDGLDPKLDKKEYLAKVKNVAAALKKVIEEKQKNPKGYTPSKFVDTLAN